MGTTHAPGPRSRRRWLTVTLFALPVVPLAAAAIGWGVLRSSGGRAWLLARVAERVERAYGVRLEIGDFTAAPWRGVLELRDVAVRMPTARPFLTAGRVVVEVEPRSLLGSTVVVRSVVVEAPRLDLGAPRPPLTGTPGSSASPSRRIEIERAQIRNGALLGVAVPPLATRWVSGWRAGNIAVTGSYLGGRLEAHLTVGTLVLDTPGGDAVELALSADLEGEPARQLRLGRLEVKGRGISLAASGAAALDPPGPVTAAFTLALEPAVIAPTLRLGGRISAEGEIEARTLSGHVAVRAQDLSLAFLRASLPPDVFDGLEAESTVADVEVRGHGSFADPETVEGTVNVALRREARELLTARCSFGPGSGTPTAGVRARIEASLLPSSPGVRRLAGTLAATSWTGAADGRLETARVEVRIPDAAAALAEVRALWPRLVPTALASSPITGSLAVLGDARGPLAGPRANVRAEWRPGPGSEVTLVATGWPRSGRGEATVTASDVRLDLFEPRLSGTVSGSLTVAGSPRAFEAAVVMDGTGLAVPGGPPLETVHLDARTDGRRLTVRNLSCTTGGRRLEGSGWAALEVPLREAGLALRLTRPVDGVAGAEIAATLRDGTVVASATASETPAGPVVVEATVPLAALRGIPGFGPRLSTLPVLVGAGPVQVSVAAPDLDSCALLAAFGVSERPERVQGGVQADLWLDPERAVESVGRLVLSGLSVTAGDRRIAADGPIVLLVSGGSVELARAALRSDGARVELSGAAHLAAAWDPTRDPPSSLVDRLELDVHGRIPAPLANPFLVGGGRASGMVDVVVHAGGRPTALTGTVAVDGSDAAFLWPTPYSTKVTQLVAKAVLADRQLRLEGGRCRLNGGPVELDARLGLDGSVEGEARFSGVRYRLDFGLWAVLSGELSLSMPPAGRSLIAGRVSLDRGWLSRTIDLEHELLPAVLGPPRVPGTETSRLDAIDLDVSLETVQGVRVRNNLADLRAGWEPLAIAGTVWKPVIRGRVEVEPGGLVFAAGQVFRLDRASATFNGDPDTDPKLDFVTTSSLQDPTIGRTGAGTSQFFQAERGAASTVEASSVLSSGVASLLGQQAGQKLGVGEVTVCPVPVWGEEDPTARLTLSRSLSSNATFLVSLDLRNAQRQTYVLDLHGLRSVPTLQAQVFTNDQARQGATVQQTLDLGGPTRRRESLALLQGIVVQAPPEIEEKVVRGAVRLRPGDAIRPGATLDAEVDVAEALRALGYMDVDVSTAVRPAAGTDGRQELVVSVVPGPRAEFRFAGDALPAAARRAVAALYRSDYYEAESLQEMRGAAVRAFRSLGYLEPEVEVAARRPTPAEAGSEIVVTVTSRAGRRVTVSEVQFAGVPTGDAQALAFRFSGSLVRTELAAGLPGADARVSESLRQLGYREGRVAGRELLENGTRLVVHLVVGPLVRLAAVSLVGVSDEDGRRLTKLLGVHEGDPVRADLVAAGAAVIVEDLHARGFADVRVSPVLRGVRGGDDLEKALTYEVAVGTRFRVADVRLEGLRWTSPSFVRHLVALEPDQPLVNGAVIKGRGRLLDTGVFSTVLTRTEKEPDGRAVVTFSAVERPRFTLSYGVRWESEIGASGVLEFIDHNLLGRAITGGVQLRYEPDDRSARLYLGAHEMAGTQNSLETFVERRRVLRYGLVTDTSQATVQLSRPLGSSVVSRLYGRYKDTHLYEENPNPFEPPYDVRIRHPYVGVQVVWDVRNDPIMATGGQFASVDVSLSNQLLGSDFHYLRLYGQFNLYRRAASMAGVDVTWGQSVRVGLAHASGQELIPDARFYAGGSYSVRGYDTESLGPTEELGGTVVPVGGAALLVINEELRVPLGAGLTGLLFVDAGQVWADIGDFGTSLAKSIGLGLRAGTPLGLLRFDAAHPLDAPPGAKSVRFTLGFGNVF